jgi:adenosylcobinamide-phosphate synthase
LTDAEFQVLIIVSAFILDIVFGDPQKIPHVTNLFGKAISIGEKWFYAKKKKNGFILVFVLVNIVFWSSVFIFNFLKFNIYIYFISNVFIAFQLLAGTTLIKVSRQIFIFLKNNELKKARAQVKWLVGRDTEELSEQSIKQATLESMAENLSDGTIAPLFYFAVAGIPGMMTYKMINTLDSRIGYRNERYNEFGYFAAILDDLFNFIPARITAILMAVVSLSAPAFSYIHKFGNAHTSPNAGYPEAALAGILNCRFGGSHLYFGKNVEKPFIGKNKRDFVFQDFKKSAFVSRAATVLFLVIFAGIVLIKN